MDKKGREKYMGDRVSIQFKDGQGRMSAVLSNHWGGMEFVKEAKEFIHNFKTPPNEGLRMKGPFYRRDADTMMVAFIQSLRMNESLSIVPTKNDCDNSDNGHHILDSGSPKDAYTW